jgi:hypothetical protein
MISLIATPSPGCVGSWGWPAAATTPGGSGRRRRDSGRPRMHGSSLRSRRCSASTGASTARLGSTRNCALPATRSVVTVSPGSCSGPSSGPGPASPSGPAPGPEREPLGWWRTCCSRTSSPRPPGPPKSVSRLPLAGLSALGSLGGSQCPQCPKASLQQAISPRRMI